MLSDSTRTPINYNRLKNRDVLANQNIIKYNSATNTISTIVSEEYIGISELQIVNMQGAITFSSAINSSSQSFILSAIPSGIYLCRLSRGNSDPIKISVIIK